MPDSTSLEKNSSELPEFQAGMDTPPTPPSSEIPPLPPSSQTPPPLPPSADSQAHDEAASPAQPDDEASPAMTEEVMALSQQLETMVMGVAQQDTNSLAGTELEIGEARRFLHSHKLRHAMASVAKAEASLIELEEDDVTEACVPTRSLALVVVVAGL